ncbi:hypothetical protein GDO81_025390 [Engystomops pustulosus]|uniref:Uncharacterized protein n=1 Tax=Engystomops pustulosus TaxID=76066 RepID=A0AAV6ZTX3_ENGPU|nr:hypothetical protein GDO81_025390 [Engystomops pustulosus]
MMISAVLQYKKKSLMHNFCLTKKTHTVVNAQKGENNYIYKKRKPLDETLAVGGVIFTQWAGEGAWPQCVALVALIEVVPGS